METVLGHDFSEVRVHTDDSAHRRASAIGARAYTVGSDVAFQHHEYDPVSQAGRVLLAHELTHVVQQRAGRANDAPTGAVPWMGAPGGRCEREATAEAARVLSAAPGHPGRDEREVSTPSYGRSGWRGSPVLQRSPETGSPNQATSPAAPWRTSGNLTGHPPVRSETAPPNVAVPEHEQEFTTLYAAAVDVLSRQRVRAEAMAPGGSVTDFRYWFAKVYSFVTEMELDYIRDRAYYYPSYVLRSLLYFEKIYADNFVAFSSGARVEDHWRAAFERMARNRRLAQQAWRLATDPELLGPIGEPGATGARGGLALNAARTAVQTSADSLVAGMQAHIRFDLPRAENWVFTTYYAGLPGVRMADFRADFFNMSGVFDEAGRRMNADMSAKLHLPVHLVPQMLQDFGMRHFFDADMPTERLDTWRRAEELLPLATPDPYRMGTTGLTGSVTEGDHLSALAQLPTTSLRPSMSASAPLADDDEIREQVDRWTRSELALVPGLERVGMLRGLLRGVTSNSDEAAVLRILESSSDAGDLVVIVDAADAWELLYALDGEEYRSLRLLLTGSYYPATQFRTAQRLVERCIDGETAEWEERMVVDVFAARPPGERLRLLEHLGRTRGNSDARSDTARGIDVVRDNLTGAEESDFDALLAPLPL